MIKESFLTIDAIAQRDNLFTRMDARVKVFLCVFILAAVTALPGLRLPISVLTLALTAALLIKTPFKLILGRLVPPLVFGIFFLVIMLFSEGSHRLFSIQVYGLWLSGYREGLDMGITVLARIIASMSVILFLSVTTPIYDLGRAMMWFRIPKVIVEILLLTYRYIFVLWDEGMRIRDAQMLRLGYSVGKGFHGWKKSISSTFTLMGMVIIRAYDRADHTFSAMYLRGYTGGMTGNPHKVWSKVDTKNLLSGIIVFIALILASV